MKNMLTFIPIVLVLWLPVIAQEGANGLRSDPKAVARAQAMVESMGGKEIWAQLKSIHFIHEWYPVNRVDSYMENEILDLTGPRSWVERKSEINLSIRAYSPEGRHWTVNNGEFAFSDDDVFASSQKRAPFNFYRLVRAVAAADPNFKIRFGDGDIPGTRRLEFYGPDGVFGGWVILNARNGPIVKATREYRYTLGPLKRFGNLLVPGFTRYQMVSVNGGNRRPDPSLFIPPVKKRQPNG